MSDPDRGVRWVRRLDGGVPVDLAVRRSRGGTGRPVLAVHGMGGDHTTWRRLAARLRADGRSVVSYDQRGHGQSSRGVYDLDRLRDDLLSVVGDLPEDQTVDVVAHSLGAHVALRAAMAAPERFGRLVLEEVPPTPRDAADVAEGITPTSSPRELVLGVLDLIRDPRPVMRFDARLAPTVQAAFGEPDPDWWAGLRRVQTPVLVVSGGEQSFLPPRHLRTLAGALPDGHFLSIPTGHSVHRDRPDDFAAATLAFLRGEDVGRS
ncbi:MAG: alpha/beta fold hydrolase [Williamsia herbipolensis]|nr:alpha/beta fold hydrolase [Williamsia herbipolensis]